MKIKQHQGTAIAKQLLAKLGSKINAVALVVALFASAMLNAQTQKVYPTYFKGHDISEILASSDPDMRQIYLYNVGLKKFIIPGGAWGTSLDLGDTGLAFHIVKDNSLPLNNDAYYLYSRGVLTEVGSGLAMYKDAPAAKPLMNVDRNIDDPHVKDRPRIMLRKIPNITHAHIYVMSGYENGERKKTLRRGMEPLIEWKYSHEYFAVARKTPTVDNTYVEYLDDFEKAKALGDSLVLWKIVTLKDLKAIVTDVYRANQETANVSYVMKDPWVMRSQIRHQNWNITPQNALFNDVSIINRAQTGMLAHAEFQGKAGRMSQTVTVTHPGWYIITCEGFVYKSANSDIKEQLFAIDNSHPDKEGASQYRPLYSVSSLSNMPDYLERGRKFYRGEYGNNSVMIYVYGDKSDKNFKTTITLGVDVTGNKVQPSDVVAFDDFKIEYTGINMIVLDEDRSDKEYIEKQVAPNTSRNLIMQRSLKENQWNSIILPFDLTGDQVEKAFGSNAKVSKFKGPSAVKETLIEFESVALGAANKNNVVIEAGKLYLIYPTKTLEYAEKEKIMNVFSPSFGKQEIGIKGTYITLSGVSLTRVPSLEMVEEPYKHSAFGASSLRFYGTYVSHSDNIVPANSFVLNKDGYWYRTTKAHNVKGFRCWIQPLHPATSHIKRLNVSIDGVLLNGSSDTITGIEEMEFDGKEPQHSVVYDAFGRVIGTSVDDLKDDFKGVYIINGKKYIKQ